MVRAIQVNSLGFVEWLLRLRPGVAISLAAHVALLLFLAIVLAFPPNVAPPPADKDVFIELSQPMVSPAAQTLAAPLLQPTIIAQLDKVTLVPPLPIPPVHAVVVRTPIQETTAASALRPVPPLVPAVIVNPSPISRGGLVYPNRAAELGLGGSVDFSFVIESDGSVGDAQVIAETPSGYGFANAARKAFLTWRFAPKLIDGKPVAASARIRITFRSR